jgi:hypothetical protein
MGGALPKTQRNSAVRSTRHTRKTNQINRDHPCKGNLMKNTPPIPPRQNLPLVVHPQAPGAADMPHSPAGQTPPKQNTFAALLIESLSLQVQSFYVRQFLEEVLAEPDIRQVLATPVRAEGKTVRLLVQVVVPIAEEAERIAQRYTDESEAAYVATLLHGVDYCFFAALRGKYDVPDALKSMVWPALRRLERHAPEAAAVLRTCMRWGNFDEEGVFVDWLEQRMQHALEVLRLASF